MRTVTWKFTPPPPDRSAPHRGCAGQGFTADLPQAIWRKLASGGGFQHLRCNMSTCSDFAVRDAFADFVEGGAQKRGGCRVEHELPPRRENPILACFLAGAIQTC
ncbi:protein of unknown function [Bradyrhizobium vignae]|uniref:Uncharacterized protein n=1 Tax=Bradyrhizobium vignae TaxID=1549949 RepID=A0A2U3PV91_9BRAD|nr:protein of unknown function [Bradyrhizobium vignae]